MYQACGSSETTFASWGEMFGGGSRPHPIKKQLSNATVSASILFTSPLCGVLWRMLTESFISNLGRDGDGRGAGGRQGVPRISAGKPDVTDMQTDKDSVNGG